MKADKRHLADEISDDVTGRDNGGVHTNGNRTNGHAVSRTTIVVPANVDANWQAYALLHRRNKNEVVVEALRRFLVEAGLEPDKAPKLSLSY